ncbi:MAG: hypothetical protein LHW55_02365, partial [Candidatus Cloacimonetes bacterium]|nr:hypothetical protein [Candidatus Cloacimonadota bacterium]
MGGIIGSLATPFPYYVNKRLSGGTSKEPSGRFDVHDYFDKMVDQLQMSLDGINSKYYPNYPMSCLVNSFAEELTVEGNYSVGGILGYQLFSDIRLCYSKNEVQGEEEVGGLVGHMENSFTINTYSRGPVEAWDKLGGLIGKLTGSTIVESYSTGEIITILPYLESGGLVGCSELGSVVSNSYWDIESSNWWRSAGGEGKTTAEMTNYPYGMNTYNQWRFFSTWLPDEVLPNLPGHIFPMNEGYPVISTLIKKDILDDYFEGEGTELSPYEVFTWHHLFLMRNSFIMDKHFVQTDDIDFSIFPFFISDGWLPIGNVYEAFTGSFNGNGYVISNLQGVSGSTEIGLFGVVKNAKFIDISLDNFSVHGTENVGSLAGQLIDTYTKNISVSNSRVSGKKNIGGLYGKVERKNVFADNSAIKGVTVENTSVTGSYLNNENIGGVIGYCSIDVSNPNYNYNPVYIRLNDIVVDGVTLKGAKNVGGAIGYAYNNYIIGNGTLDHSIAASSIEIEGQENVGGVIGYYQTRSRNLPSSTYLGVTLADISVNNASIEATSANNVGGAIGYVNNADIDNSVITDLSIEVDNSENIGGLIGYQFGSKMTSCSVEGGIIGEASENIGGLIGYGKDNRGIADNIEDSSTHIGIGIFGDSSNIGGLVGLGYKGGAKECSSQGSIYRTHNIGTVNNVGGLIGTGIYSFSLKECFAATHIKANHRLGGLVGNFTDIASNTFMSVEDCYATGNIEGEANVGGLVGYLGYRSIVSNSYSIGKVSGSLNVGGLIGNSEGGNNTINNSYWDIVTSYKNISGTNDTGEGLMTVDMVRDNSEYTDWNFYNVWAMEDYTTYPYLKWQDKPGVHNYPKHGYHKVYKGKTVYWESFPVLLYNGIDFAEVLEPLTDLEVLENVYAQDNVKLEWDNGWDDNLDLVKTGGYKLEFIDNEEYELIVPGTAVDYDNTTVTLKPVPNENWVGYWIPQPQKATDVFDKPEFDYVKEVR